MAGPSGAEAVDTGYRDGRTTSEVCSVVMWTNAVGLAPTRIVEQRAARSRRYLPFIRNMHGLHDAMP